MTCGDPISTLHYGAADAEVKASPHNVLTAVIVKEHYWAERTDMRPMRSLGVKALTHRQLVFLQFTLST